MDLLTVWFHLFPWLSLVAVICLVAITVWMWVPRPNAAARSFQDGFGEGYKTGHKEGIKEGYAAGAEDNHLEEGHFIKCPECDHAIHIPTILHVTGEPGEQLIDCEPDTTELWVHMNSHKDA
ncbi:hypothetical protein HYP71_gp103 [Arthrobacter phage KBurrousTX]|uniref:Uncharacterized protein n=1 Tax=Arthrobacter phage KBurrousTX TaxID=2315608 RepID=A0A386K978_9CAUD|nr:hypothetical protein HYP71_gp103 [Arthrobacter phage KBurrousTX]AYD81597.1 hypothetical protein KBurrousTX_103 [Arthrobacter phage KBurrousTX]